MSDSKFVFAATDGDFDQLVLERSRELPVVVDFWAPWCGPCRQLAPVLERLVEARGGQVLLAKVNTDEEQGLAARYRVEALPTVIAFRDGQPVLDFVGLLPEQQLADFLDRICPSQAERQAREAEALAKTNPPQAEKLYRQALQDNPHQEAAVLGLAQLLIERDQDAEAAELLDRVGIVGTRGPEVEQLRAVMALRQEAPSHGDEPTLREKIDIDPRNPQLRYEVGCVLAGKGKYQEALEQLMLAAELDRKLATGKARETMVKIFHAVGVRSPLADEYRNRLTGLLY
jgi:putative thioredoxin